MKHTPAPWKITNLKECPTPGYAYLVGGNGINTHVALTVCENDARLIAAAPELLDALDALYNSFVIEGTIKGNKGNRAKYEMIEYNNEVRQALNNARAAIAKATA